MESEVLRIPPLNRSGIGVGEQLWLTSYPVMSLAPALDLPQPQPRPKLD